jgi:hypothetical protein
MPLRQRLYHLELKVVQYFAIVQDSQISVIVDLQCRRDFANDVFPVSSFPFTSRPYDLDLTGGNRSLTE